MARPDKASAVAELAEEFRNSAGAVLTEYRGLSVKQLQDLRRVLGDNASYAVVKNTLTKIAAREAGVTAFDDLLVGPSAIAFIKGDAVEAAKGLRDFARTNSPLVIKGGVLDGKALTTDEIARIADLETREVLLAKLAGALLASLQNAVFLFNAPLAQVARLAGALEAKATDDPSILGGGSGQPAGSDSSAAADTSVAADSTDGSTQTASGDAEAAPVADAADTTSSADADDSTPVADAEDTTPAADAGDTTPVPEAGAEQTNEG